MRRASIMRSLQGAAAGAILFAAAGPVAAQDLSHSAGADARTVRGSYEFSLYQPGSGFESFTYVLPGQLAAAPPSTFEPVASDPKETQVAFGIADRGQPLGGILSELRVGVLYHDVGLISASTEDGIDINAEALFASPEFMKYILSPRPHLGFSINTEGDTSQGYFGLSWTFNLIRGLFAEISFGGSVHDGILSSTDANQDQNEFGCRLLFRESVSLGWQITEHHNISAMFDHISNAGLCDENEGMDTAGIRYGYRF